MEHERRSCEVCGAPAYVQANVGTEDGEPVMRHFCLECAEKCRDEHPAYGRSRAGVGLSKAGLLILSGVTLGFLALLGDYLGIPGRGGFGWYQGLGVAAGMLFLVIGALFRVGSLSVGGLVLFLLALSADLIHVGHSPGLGWKQQACMLIAAVMLGTGLVLLRRERRAEQ